ncbi:protein SCO1/2 [Sinobacterium caligoides]|uniref:Protein SCO1/2 n=1 Tax=Sinobacterium caligoides TaxID=933926 RepID=A0A3N2DMF5_9GAMM|nr:SCO family protein [Sinobacterium caligoides]ROS00974.1 protein SCO1/2 [Sinobacterium caligoides]
MLGRETALITLAMIIFLLLLSAPLMNVLSSSPLSLSSGRLLSSPMSLQQFTLEDHRGNRFDHADLLGRWNILSYGFIHCPDLCPSSLAVIKSLKQRLVDREEYDDVGVLFYSVDPERDSVEKMARFVAHFGADIVGLRAPEGVDSDGSKAAFERSLAMKVVISNDGPENSYNVSHGMSLYLFNPQAELYAVFWPHVDDAGRSLFNLENLYEDYLLIRERADIANKGDLDGL